MLIYTLEPTANSLDCALAQFHDVDEVGRQIMQMEQRGSGNDVYQ